MYRILGLLGILIMIGPFVFGYSGDPFALWTNLVIGFVVLDLAIREAVIHDRENWEYWVTVIFGLGLIGAPFLLGFGTMTTALWMTTVGGMLMVILAAIRLSEKKRSK